MASCLLASRSVDDRRVHPLEIPLVWFGINLAEWLIVSSLLVAVLPDAWPTALIVAVWVVTLGVVAASNYWVRRRFIPR